MPDRLPFREGEWIDRTQPVAFRFEGKPFEGFLGDSLSSALWGAGARVLGRSFKYHRARGVYSLTGYDVNCLVEDGQRTNLRGDTLSIVPDLDVRSVNTLGGVDRDRLKIIDRFGAFMPVGFYYKAFYTPRRLFSTYENQMRKIAGLGKINPNATPVATPKDYAFCDLLVVGGGPSGLAAAIAAAETGLEVLLVDEQPHLGGSLLTQHAHSSEASEKCSELVAKAESLANLQIRLGTQVAGHYADQWVALVDHKRLTKLRTRSTLFATGCVEQPAVFQNNDLPGVMLGSAAQRLIYLYRVPPCQQAVILTANQDGYRLALDFVAAGITVVAVVDLRHDGEQSGLDREVAEAGVEIFRGHTVYEALAGSQGTKVNAAILCPLDGEGKPDRMGHLRLACDGIMMSVGWAPNAGVAYQAGVRFTNDESLNQLVPGHIPEGIFAAGRVAGLFELQDQLASGERAGLQAAAYLGSYEGEIPAAPDHQGPPPSHPYPIFAHKGKKNFVDLDEDLHLVDFKNAHHEGYDNIELLKRYSTVGMGPTQGKLSNTNAVRILAHLNGATINETGTTVSRPFHHPVSLENLAGRRFHPHRQTPLEAIHRANHAEMMHAGAWFRPEYYHSENSSREECILQEARQVRHSVGVIDVSTLGKLQITGPDAARFLEQIYTGRFTDQPVGRLRYAVGCDELGVIIEDGVVARVAEDHFYVTATSSGAAAFYRDLQRWAMLWRLDVQLVNATGHLAAVNLAGPQSRVVLEKLTDFPLSQEDFRYLDVHRAEVAGVDALLMRIGFVGELGFEIHMPVSRAVHVWNALMKAGAAQGIRPFGVEAQRLLRLEKGHIIVGQDTDALTHPYEVGLDWAVKQDKPFFVGSRSLKILREQPMERTLVGLMLSEPDGVEECHLILAGDLMIGRITSVAHRTTLGQPLALAFLEPDRAAIGTEVTICGSGGKRISARVVPLPFYDPDGLRQKLKD
ncbi:MAG: 2Fe-2S iron-sulfur cluster-binding protein [Planctomycetota bacterium]|nr:2Fe-2S iron-sulfur cluster-binding protein [Planctomycetota bacterium]